MKNAFGHVGTCMTFFSSLQNKKHFKLSLTFQQVGNFIKYTQCQKISNLR
jgi:hypothetical protein